MALQAKDLTPVSKEVEPVMGISHHQEPDGILLPGCHANDTLATTMLHPIGLRGHPLDKAPLA